MDSSAELKDAFEDISEVLGGLNRNDFDEDELMAEIELAHNLSRELPEESTQE